MLVLRRRVGETILVGDDVEIEVIEISRSRVKLGVRAPGQISVVRKETRTISKENRLASDLIVSRGHEGVGELLQLLKAAEDGSTKQSDRRYETLERYSGYRDNRENPHPA